MATIWFCFCTLDLKNKIKGRSLFTRFYGDVSEARSWSQMTFWRRCKSDRQQSNDEMSVADVCRRSVVCRPTRFLTPSSEWLIPGFIFHKLTAPDAKQHKRSCSEFRKETTIAPQPTVIGRRRTRLRTIVAMAITRRDDHNVWLALSGSMNDG